MLVAMALDSQEVVLQDKLFLTDIEYSMLVSITGAAYVSGSFLCLSLPNVYQFNIVSD